MTAPAYLAPAMFFNNILESAFSLAFTKDIKDAFENLRGLNDQHAADQDVVVLNSRRLVDSSKFVGAQTTRSDMLRFMIICDCLSPVLWVLLATERRPRPSQSLLESCFLLMKDCAARLTD